MAKPWLAFHLSFCGYENDLLIRKGCENELDLDKCSIYKYFFEAHLFKCADLRM